MFALYCYVIFYSRREFLGINLSTIQEYVTRGRLTPNPNEMITIRDLVQAGLTTNPLEGIKLLGNVRNNLLNYNHEKILIYLYFILVI